MIFMITNYSPNSRLIHPPSLHSNILRSQNIFVCLGRNLSLLLTLFFLFLASIPHRKNGPFSAIAPFFPILWSWAPFIFSITAPDCFFLTYLTFYCQSKILFSLPCPGICPLTWEKFSRDTFAFYIYDMFLGIIFIVNITL